MNFIERLNETIIAGLVGMGLICFVYVIINAFSNKDDDYDDNDSDRGKYLKK